MGKCVKCHKNYNYCRCKNHYSNNMSSNTLSLGSKYNSHGCPYPLVKKSNEDGHMHVHVHVDENRGNKSYKRECNGENTYGLIGMENEDDFDNNYESYYSGKHEDGNVKGLTFQNLTIGRNIYLGNLPSNSISKAARSNISIGIESLNSLTSGSRNIILGYQSGELITSGNNNLVLGYRTEPSSGSSINEIVIGNNATGKGADYAVIGNNNTRGLYISQDGRADLYALNIISPSDKRLKKNIIEIKFGLNFICKLNPVCYQWIDTTVSGNKIHQGLIAQEVKELIEDEDENIDKTKIVEYNEEDDIYRINYMELISPLIKSVQELKLENDSLKKLVKKQNNNINELFFRIDKLEKKL